MRAIAHFARAVGAFRALDDVRRLQAVAGDLLDRLVQHLAVVGRIDRERRGAGRDDREHVAFVDQRLRDALEQIADAAGVAEVEVQVVDDDQEDAAGGVVARARDREDQAFLAAAGAGGVARLCTRPPCTSVSDVMSCLTPSS